MMVSCSWCRSLSSILLLHLVTICTAKYHPRPQLFQFQSQFQSQSQCQVQPVVDSGQRRAGGAGGAAFVHYSVAFQLQYAGQARTKRRRTEFKYKHKQKQRQKFQHHGLHSTNTNNNNNNNSSSSSNQNDALKNFITKEKTRMEKLLAYEKRRLGRLNDFLASEKTRLKNLEKQEKKSFSSMFFDDEKGVAVGDLSSALTVLDSQWQISSRSRSRNAGRSNDNNKTTSKSGWSKLTLDPVASAPNDSKSGKGQGEGQGVGEDERSEEFVFLYEPSTTSPPSYVILFLGGAALGQFPHITYSEMLTRISHKLNAAILTAPYQTGLDHYELSKETGVLLHRALAQCREKEPERYTVSTPKFLLGHSLGSKLWTISTAAMSDCSMCGDDELAGVGLISFNNFGFVETTKQVKTFADAMELKNNNSSSNRNSKTNRNKKNAKMVDTILEFAEQAVTVAGLEFTPSPSTTTDRIINQKYNDNLLRKTRLFVFDDDDLDSSKSFFDAAAAPSNLSVSGLPGSHLAPVYIKLDLELGLNDVDFPPEARQFAQDATGGVQSFSYGDESYLVELVDEVCGWILGGSPTRGPSWENGRAAPIVMRK